MSRWLAERAGEILERRTTRRGFLSKTTLGASAVVAAPMLYVLRPVDAYAAICGCAGQSCPCGSACCEGFTEFCCNLTGLNACPPGSFAGGWWKADGSPYCSGPRYFIDCHSRCTCQGNCAAGSAFCGGNCDPVGCECGNKSCGNRQTGCVSFRYGQCNQHVGCAGRITCRVVSCTAPWLIDPTCTTTPATDNRTAGHVARCADLMVVGIAGAPDGKGYWIAQSDGGVFAYGSAPFRGSAPSLGIKLPRLVTGIAADPQGGGYWLATTDGGVFAFGATFAGSLGATRLNKPIMGIAGARDGAGYWMFGADGGVFAFGVPFTGSTADLRLNQPIVAMAGSADGGGYWLTSADGGVFAFGNAQYHGSAAGAPLAARIVSMATTAAGDGYWLLAADGGIFAFGASTFLGSLAGSNAGPVVSMAATSSGAGYWILGRDGVVHPFGDAGHFGDRRPT